MKAIDAMLGHLYGIRAQLVSEIRRSDDASAAWMPADPARTTAPASAASRAGLAWPRRRPPSQARACLTCYARKLKLPP